MNTVSGTPQTVAYTYGDTTHPDRLTNFNGTAISYNQQGCPTSMGAKTIGWNQGRLSSISIGNPLTGQITTSFTYNANGQRTRKTQSSGSINGTTTTTTNYIYDDTGRLVTEEISTLSMGTLQPVIKKTYIYDGANIIGMVYNNYGYYFQRNIQGDVVGVYNSAGTKVVTFTYDAFGKCTISGDINLALACNIRYRGYYYDTETGFYWIQTRYYNPDWCRWISPDNVSYLDPESANGLNLYLYCGNDPINRVDPTGQAWDFVIDLAFIIWGVHDLANGGYKDWENWVALGIDVLFAVLPFVPAGAGQVIKVGNKIDNAVDVASAINKIDNIQDMSKVTMIGRDQNRVTDTATLIGKADNLFEVWKGYDATATGLKKFVHGGITMVQDTFWMFGKLRSGYTVIDIGITTLHRGRGIYYGAERFVIGLWKTRNLWKLPINYYL